eukprot:snap_masked-scaffold_15-processed-gene-7.11-mRNA-1 protein AED:0.05 eAED:0.05 QI:0/-1/0/1/-1/1/1/0/92
MSKKVKIRFKPVGNAPILRETRITVDGDKDVYSLTLFLKKRLSLKSTDPLYIYCCSAFSPDLEQKLGDLHTLFAEKQTKELIIDYSIINAYG